MYFDVKASHECHRAMRAHTPTKFLLWPTVAATIVLLASIEPLVAALSVRFIVTEPPGTNPYDILGLRGCNQVAQADSSVQCLASEVSMTLPLSFIESEIQRVSAQDDVVVALGHGYSPALANLATQFPAKSYVSIDQAIEPPRNNTIGLSFAEEHAGFQAGALAGLFTRGRRVGVIGGLPVTPVLKFVNSYLAGVQHVCPTCEVHVEAIPTFSNVTAGRQAAISLLSQGADVVFNAAGAAGGGGILEAAQRGAFVIGVDLDESQFTFRNQPAQVTDRLLSSAIKRTDLAVKTALESIRLGKRGFNRVLDSTTGGVGLLQPFVSSPTRNFTEPVNVAIRSASSLDGCPTATRWTRQEILEKIELGFNRAP
ncbi:basic membrane protein-domain-containing protein [Catenaria anguillulae PL171]|uniref:Basic membrane protein-domain-containing protein n=1 Tax=Catenaria anguillulae PL171 TaxID=765915 RepID=A0A1Y2I242_9FUNG|nr:basic membrane protein-domain-containing protein [Catenaria anguillulae PL171]